MNTKLIPLTQANQPKSRLNLINRLARNGFVSKMNKLKHGEIILKEGENIISFGEKTEHCPLSVTLTVNDQQFFSDIGFGGSVGAGESYIHGKWFCSDLTGLVRIFLLNREIMDDIDDHIGLIRKPLYKLLHWLNRNTHTGSKRNIGAHYDLGNDLFSLFLDKNLMYSCALYEEDSYTLEQASDAKLDLICRKLDLKPTDHVLEIGTGWGGFAIYAAKNYGCKVTTTTISQEQYNKAQSRISEHNLGDQINLLLKDYRELTGQYDNIP